MSHELEFGLYLSPQPLLQSPGYQLRMAGEGLGTPTYSYALNNPLRFVDEDGLKSGDRFSGRYTQNLAAAMLIFGPFDLYHLSHIDSQGRSFFTTNTYEQSKRLEQGPYSSPRRAWWWQ